MKKKNALAKKVLCSLLAAGVLGVAGSAMAASYGYNTKTNTADINNVISNGSISDVDYGIYYEKKTDLKFSKDNIDINAKQYGVYGKYNGEFAINAANALKISASNDSTTKVSTIYIDPISKKYPLNKLTISANTIDLNAKGIGTAYGIYAAGGQSAGENYVSEIAIGNQNTKTIIISSEGKSAIGIYLNKNASVIASANDITINSIGTSTANGVSNNGNASTPTIPTKAELSLTADNSLNISAKATDTVSAITSSGYYSETKLEAATINLKAENTSEKGNVYSIHSTDNSKLTLTSNDVIISSKSTSTTNGNAYGINSTNNATTIIDSEKIAINVETGDTNSYAVYNDDSKTSIGKYNADIKLTSISNNGLAASIVASGSKKTGNVDIWGKNINVNTEGSYAYGLHAIQGNTINIGSDASAIDIIANGKDDAVGIFAKEGGQINVAGNTLNIKAASDNTVAGISTQNNTSEATENLATVNIKTAKTVIDAKTGIAAYSQGVVNINDGDLEINAEKAIETRGHATTNINKDGTHTVKLNGDVVFDVTNDGGSGLVADATVNINLDNADSYMTGSVKTAQSGTSSDTINMDVNGMKMSISNGAAWNMTGDSFVNEANVKDGGSINVQENVDEFTAGKISLNNGKLNLQGEKQAVNITNLNGAGTVATNSLDNKVNVKSVADNSNITVLGSGDIADAIKSDASNAQQLANVVTTGSGDDAKSAANVIKTEEGKVAGAFYAEVGADGNVDTNTIVQAENSTNRAISDMASISLMTWRSENNDMNKRLGELRDSKGEHGAWARMARGESKYGAQNVKNQYNYYQVGYDEKLSTNPNWTVGVALSRTEGSSTFVNGSGENKHTGLAVYGSYLSESGSFVDLIAKYARMDNEYTTTIGAGSGDYETNGYSLSAEYGKRFTKDNGFWIEPQVELTYGRVGSADYVTANGVHARQDDMNSIVGRLGFSLGKDIKQGNVYVRASYLYDFDGETDVKMVDTTSGAKDAYKQDLGGGWWEVGVGTNLNLSEATHLYFDVEKTYGGNVATPWQWNAGVRWSF